MPAKLWPVLEAEAMLDLRGDQPDKTYITETGFGATGFPHFGTFGEVVRTNFIMRALRDRGYASKLISFSDDLDPLRKIPPGLPDWLKEHIGKPVSSIPDPLGDEYESFADRVNHMLIAMLNRLEVEYEFVSSTATYRSGRLNRQLEQVIQKVERVQEIVTPYLREETAETWFPFFPICEHCGRIGTTRVVSVDKDKLTVRYVCDRPVQSQQGCGHEGEVSVLNGTGKLQWRVDWAARWAAFDVDYEMYGKDLIETAECGDTLMREIFEKTPPAHMFYEMFLDEDGKKMSKSRGTTMDMDVWLKYSSMDSLRLMLFDNPRSSKAISRKVIPRYADRLLEMARAYYDPNREEKDDFLARSYQFATLFNPPAEPPLQLEYETMCNLIGNLGINDPALVEQYLKRTGLIPQAINEVQRAQLLDLIRGTSNYYQDIMADEKKVPTVGELETRLLNEFVTFLESGDQTPDDIQSKIFDLARSNDLKPQKFFGLLYGVILQQERGPRLGTFIQLVGQQEIASIIRSRLAALQTQSEE